LGDWVHKAQLDLNSLLHIADAICGGMIAIQNKIGRQQPFVHRDLKPSNILITKEGGVKITDFGLAKVIQANSKSLTTITPANACNHNNTQYGMTINGICGTPGYMSPEQIMGRNEIDRRTDIYSFGCILYEMCTGHLVFGFNSIDQIMEDHLNHKPIAPTNYNAKIPSGIVNIIGRCLSKRPEDRYDSFADVRNAINEAYCIQRLLFHCLGFSLFSDNPRARKGMISKGFEAHILDGLKGIDYVIELGLVKDQDELDNIRETELKISQPMDDERKNAVNDWKMKKECAELVLSADALVQLAQSSVKSREESIRFCSKAIEKYREAQKLVQYNPEIGFRIGKALMMISEILRPHNANQCQQYADVAIIEFSRVMKEVRDLKIISVGEIDWLLPHGALFFRAGCYRVIGDSENALNDLNKLIHWCSNKNDPQYADIFEQMENGAKRFMKQFIR
jgi:serine/threonine protein kinase